METEEEEALLVSTGGEEEEEEDKGHCIIGTHLEALHCGEVT